MRAAIQALKDRRSGRGEHAGLLLHRYLAETAAGEKGNPAEKRDLLSAAICAAGSQNEDPNSIYSSAFRRWRNSLPAGNVAKEFETDGRLIVGLGSENVLETGITLHHTYGMPMIPGSALKGLAAHYCDQVWSKGDRRFRKPTEEEDLAYRHYLSGKGPAPEPNYHRLLFGTTDDGGCIVFHDAWYVPQSNDQPLRLDVMTPHHLEWLEGSESPTDFDSPTPVPFLSVTGRFCVMLSWRGPAADAARPWLEAALELLSDALKNWGIGGKTTSGYGRLVEAGKTPGGRSTTARREAKPVHQRQYKVGERVQAVLLEEKTKKGGWNANLTEDERKGPIQNSNDVPPDKKPGDEVTLEIAFINPKTVAFRWPTPKAGK